MKKKIFLIDIDNTICRTKGNSYKKAKPFKNKIILINKLYKKGHTIKFFTSRFMGRNKDSVNKAKKQGLKFTKKQLKIWKCNYHFLIFGKPSHDILIDDKSINYNQNWHKKIEKKYL
tara:strand:+ start:43 stop:393 length:351 start_codon:yes stop_codon:yes gene_type:complete